MRNRDRENALRHLSDWLKRSQAPMRDEPTATIMDIFKAQIGLTDRDKAKIASHLDSIASWYYGEGLWRILREDGTGWSLIRRGMQYSYWHIRVLVGCWERDTRRTKQPRVLVVPSSLTLALGMLLGEQEVAISWLGERLSRGVQDGAFGSWTDSPVPAYVLRLYQRTCGLPEQFAGLEKDRGLQPHAEVFLHWDSEVALREDITRMCDYHISRSEDDSDDYLAEFAEPPYDILPIEVYLLYRVRERLGNGSPRVDHPAFSITQESIPRECPSLEHDCILDAVSNRCG